MLLIFSLYSAMAGVTTVVIVGMLTADSVATAQSALDRASQIDLLVTDVVMPNMSGCDLADQLGNEFAGLKVLFMSGSPDNTLLRHGVYGARESFLQKPFVLRALASKVRETLTGTKVTGRS